MLERIGNMVWGPGLLLLLLGSGLWISVKNRFIQLYGWRQILQATLGTLRRQESAGRDGAMTQLQTFSTALAAAMGTGNLIGVASALCIGGPGAIFWMWISALIGMMLTYTENVLGQRYAQTRPDGTRVAGPMAYLRYGLHSPVLAGLYAVCCILASFGMGNMTQSSAIATLTERAFSIPPAAVGAAVALFLGLVLLRGSPRTGTVLQWLMPLLSAGYMLAALIVIFCHCQMLPHVFQSIFQGAFGLSAAGGGISGALLSQAIRTGLRHGVFSNEAGLGTSALVHAGGSSQNARLQGMWSMTEVALDTLVCCTLTALAILTTGAQMQSGTADGIIVAAFSSLFGSCADSIMAIITALFALCTLMGWCCCGEQAVQYLLGKRALKVYRAIYCLAAGIGAVISLRSVWALSDIANGLMAFPNLLGILLLPKEQICTKKDGSIGKL